MTKTQRFGLQTFGAGDEGSLFADGGAFTGRDRRVMDRILGALELHDHTGGSRLDDPEDAPDLELFTAGGSLTSGTTYYYRVSYIDRFGLETAASPEAAMVMPASIPSPDPPNLNAVSGGSLATGLYWYAVTVHAGGNETQMSSPQVITISDWKTVQVSAASGFPVGAEEVSVWRQGPNDAGFTRLVTMPLPGDPENYFTDDGSIPSDPCACDPANLPPEGNLTNATNSIEITIPPPGPNVMRWRIYRTQVSGAYSFASLVSEVVETEEETSGPLVTTYLDTGPVGTGRPIEVSQTLLPSVHVGEGGSSSAATRFMSGPETLDGHPMWRILAGPTGVLETRSTGLHTSGPLRTILLFDQGGVLWSLGLNEDGELTTQVSGPGDDGQSYPFGAGPNILTPDPMVSWRLGIDEEGVLFTEGAPVPGAELIHVRPSLVEPEAPASGGVIFLQGGELRWKDSAGDVSAFTLTPVV